MQQSEDVAPHLEQLWKLMDEGGMLFGLGTIRRFNGGLFHQATSLSLTADQLTGLLDAAEHDWAEVEPTIFGTLVEKALAPAERLQLGAHFTPRPYIERIVRPTVMEPLRDEWMAVEAAMLQVLGDDPNPGARATQKAVGLVQDFHRRLCQIRVLDPACGTGNFLYVTYDLLKDLEADVLRRLDDLGERQIGLQIQGQTVMPTQMLGIEKNPRAREIADLVLWIGHLQRLRRDGTHDGIRDPIIQESSHIECRDAVLVWDGERVPRRDASGDVVRVWDMRKEVDSTRYDSVIDRQVPDESVSVTVYDYPNARAPAWPEADFIVGNPPFLGAGPMRAGLGIGYTEALRRAWPQVPESADLVMYWWDRAAELTRTGKVQRFGFITTNSIHQSFQRRVVDRHLGAKPPLSIVFACPDHPWTTGKGAAAVRIAMTVGAPGERPGELAHVVSETPVMYAAAEITLRHARGRVHSNLRIGADLTSAVPLAANQGLCSPGVKLHGSGFIVTPEEARQLGLGEIPGLERHIRHYRNGRDLTQVPRGVMVIDLINLTADEVEQRFPRVHSWCVERVKPERDQNRRASRREKWWLFGELSLTMRAAVRQLPRYVGTVETAKHRFFEFLDAEILPDNMVLAMGLERAERLGVLSSRVHVVWALAAGGRLGIGNDPRYNKTKCFDAFPFPDLTGQPALRDRIARLGERLDTHRKQVQRLGKVAGKPTHLTEQYNALVRARDARAGGAAFTDRERAYHQGALIGGLQSIHDALDLAVADAYGWPGDVSDEQILERLVALNHQRAAEEAQGVVRWLRPDFQAPDAKPTTTQTPQTARDAPPTAPRRLVAWPKEDNARLLAVRDALRATAQALATDDLLARFKGARRKAVEAALGSLTALGLAIVDDHGRYSLVA